MKRYRLLFAMLVSWVLSPVAWALPDGAKIVNGQVKMNGQGNVLEILQSSPQAILNWNSFNINAGEIVRFLQPNSAAAILNRVVGQDPSRIMGLLQANGKVFLINPNGILFGPGSVVDAGSFMASTLSLSDQDFLSNKIHLVQDPQRTLAGIVSQGTIRVTDGGFVALVSPLLSHEGLIIAQGGQVALGATREATLNFDGRGLMEMVLPEGFNRNAVQNAPGPKSPVLMTQDQVGDILSSVVNTKSYVEAGAIVKKGNNLELVGAEGLLLVTGKISTDGKAGLAGGHVQLDSTQATLLSNGSQVSAKGVNSDAGSINVLSAGKTVSAGTLDVSATGVGNGGFVEVSGHDVNTGALPNLAAENGKAGTFLLDPNDIIIQAGAQGSGSLDGQMPNVNFTNATASGTVSQGALQNSTGAVALNATQDITSNVDLVFNNQIGLSLSAGRNITVKNVTLLGPGNNSFTATAGNTITGATISVINGTGSTINLTAGSSIGVTSLEANAGVGVGLVNLKAGGTIIETNGVFASTGVNITANSSVGVGNSIQLSTAQATGPAGTINVSTPLIFGLGANGQAFFANATNLRFNLTGGNSTAITPTGAAAINIFNPTLVTGAPTIADRLAPSSIQITPTNAAPTSGVGDIYLNGNKVYTGTTGTPSTSSPTSSPSPSPDTSSSSSSSSNKAGTFTIQTSSNGQILIVSNLPSLLPNGSFLPPFSPLGQSNSSSSSQPSTNVGPASPQGQNIGTTTTTSQSTSSSQSSNSQSSVPNYQSRREIPDSDQVEILRQLAQDKMGIGYKVPQIRSKNLYKLTHRDDTLYDFDIDPVMSATLASVLTYGEKPDQTDEVLDSIERNLSVTIGDGDLSFWRKLLEGFIIWEDDSE